MTISWSTDFIVVNGDGPAVEQLKLVDRSTEKWIVVVWAAPDPHGVLRYAFSRNEFFDRLRRTAVPYDPATTATLAEVLDLRKVPVSTVAFDSSQLRKDDNRREAAWLGETPERTALRYVEVDPAGGEVLAVGGFDLTRTKRTRGIQALPVDGGLPVTTLQAAEPRADDEGTAPIRFPSIEPDGTLQAGAPITLLVDLLFNESRDTLGAVALPAQSDNWQMIELDVSLQSPAIDFDNGGLGKVTVQRNASSIGARITGRVHKGLAAGSETDVKARFLLGTRFCGSAARRLVVGEKPEAVDAKAVDANAGGVQADADAAQPDLTVFITVFDEDAPGKLHWRLVTRPFPKLPPKLDGMSKLGLKPEAEAAALFKQFAKLERGKHREAIEGFGEKLWRLSPPEFQAAYWALNDHFQRPLTIQFVSDDPYMPWELMSPYRDGEAHGPIALRHAVARWIGHWQGYMPNRLPRGNLVAIAPHYKSASTQLSLAEAAAQGLVDKLGAQRVRGTREQLLQLLEQPPAEPVAMVYFTGHGAFAADDADASLIKLEDGTSLSAGEVARQKVQLGERYGTVVFFNACEVGATASVLGNVGGWADAFLSRRFGAFIAPLWAIDEEDAKQATEDLMTRIVTDRAPLGAALRDFRKKYGDKSPTFYSYLVYGDVTAHLAAAS